MKKRILPIVLGIATMIVLISGCGKKDKNVEDVEGTDVENELLQESLTSETEEYITEENIIQGAEGEKETISNMDVCLYRYDVENGNIVEYYKYNTKGILTSKKRYTEDGNVSYMAKYDDKGNETSRVCIKNNIESIIRYEYQFDISGKKTSVTEYENEEYKCRYEYNYLEDNRLSEEVFYDETGEKIYSVHYSYNEDGYISNKTKAFYVNGKEMESIENNEEYTYDSNGNVVEIFACYGDSVLFWDFYEHDENGKVILHTGWNEEDGVFACSYVYGSLDDSIKNEEQYEQKKTVEIEKEQDNQNSYYAKILTEYKIAERLHYTFMGEYLTNVNSLFYRFGSQETSLFYAFRDINSDGISELIIADDYSRYSVSGGSINENYHIYDIFTYDGTCAKKIVEGQERVQYEICENGYIRCSSSSGAYTNSIEYYTLNKEEKLLLFVGGVEQQDNYYFETTLGREQTISEKEYIAYENKYPVSTTLEWEKINR